jgi:hypothetical protein
MEFGEADQSNDGQDFFPPVAIRKRLWPTRNENNVFGNNSRSLWEWLKLKSTGPVLAFPVDDAIRQANFFEMKSGCSKTKVVDFPYRRRSESPPLFMAHGTENAMSSHSAAGAAL